MSLLLFRLTGVPEDEADDVRRLFEEHGFDTYETSAGRWHIGVAAIWLADESQMPEARQVLADYQAQRQRQARQEWTSRRQRGEHNTFLRNLARQPARVIAFAFGGLVILALSVIPFLRLMFQN